MGVHWISIFVFTASFVCAQTILLPWRVYVPCTYEGASHVFTEATVTNSPNMTHASCIATCSARNDAFAGLTNGSDCVCGRYYLGTENLPTTDCNIPCSGDNNNTCGGSGRIQVLINGDENYGYSLPDGWAPERACVADTPERVLLDAQAFILSDNTPANCVTQCESLNLAYAGVEAGVECVCGSAIKTSVITNDVSECTAACVGDRTKSCGGRWSVQIYKADRNLDIITVESDLSPQNQAAAWSYKYVKLSGVDGSIWYQTGNNFIQDSSKATRFRYHLDPQEPWVPVEMTTEGDTWPEPDRTRWGVLAVSETSTLRPNTGDYAIFAPNSGSQPAYTRPTGGYFTATTIWKVDPLRNELIILWTNPDGSPVQLRWVRVLGPDPSTYDRIYAAVSPGEFENSFPNGYSVYELAATLVDTVP